jgi:hypothetical protein
MSIFPLYNIISDIHPFCGCMCELSGHTYDKSDFVFKTGCYTDVENGLLVCTLFLFVFKIIILFCIVFVKLRCVDIEEY